METNNDNGISKENEELIGRLAGIIKKDKEARAIDAMVSEKIVSTDFHSLPVEDNIIHSPNSWLKYAAVAAAVIVLGFFAVRIVEENRTVTPKSKSIASGKMDESGNVKTEAVPDAEQLTDSTEMLAMNEQAPADEAVTGELAKAPPPPSPAADAPLAKAEPPSRREMAPPSEKIPPAMASVEMNRERDGVFGYNSPSADKSTKSRPSTMSTSNLMQNLKPGAQNTRFYGNAMDSVLADATDKKLEEKVRMDLDDESPSPQTRGGINFSKEPSKIELSEYIIQITNSGKDITSIKNSVIGILQSFGFEDINVDEKEHYIQIKTPAAKGFSNKMQKSVNYIIEVKINKDLLNSVTVKLVNLGKDNQSLNQKIASPIEDFFNKSLKSKLNTNLNK